MKSEETAATIFDCLSGEWQFKRRMGDIGWLNGTAKFDHISNREMDYFEKGVFKTSGGDTLAAHRKFSYKLDEGCVKILFADPYRLDALYVSLNFECLGSVWIASDIHRCSDDVYHHTMKWRSDSNFETVTTVNGPKKNYVLTTDFFR